MGVKATEASGTDARSDQLIGNLCLLRPTEITNWETKLGPADVVVADAFMVVNDALVEVGSVPIFWKVVRKTITDNADGDDYCLTRLVQQGRFFTCVNPTPEEEALAGKLLAAWESEHGGSSARPKAVASDSPDEEAF